MQIVYFACILFCSGVLPIPTEENTLNRVIRSPTFKKKGPLSLLFGGGGTGSGHGGHEGVNNYININNYGGSHLTASHTPHQTSNYGHGHESSSFAGSVAVAGGHGSSQTQTQSASFALGPYTASFSQSQAQGGKGGGKGGYTDFFDY